MIGIRGGKLYIGEDAIVFWGDKYTPNTGLYDTVTGSYDNSAAVSFILYQSDGTTAVSGGSGSCTYVTDTQGCYEGVLEDGVTLTANTTYVLQVLATGSSDRIGRRRVSYIAQYHGADE